MKSDIVNSDGTEILHWVMEGTQQSKTNQNYPYQPKPPKESWNIWRNSIHATYLERNRTKKKLPLVEQLLNYEEFSSKDDPYGWVKNVNRNMTLEEALQMVPPQLQEAIGITKTPNDNGKKLYDQLISTGIHSWSDGSEKEKREHMDIP